MITELKDSFNYHQSKDGIEVTRVFLMSETDFYNKSGDWYAGGTYTLDEIGTAYEYNDELQVVDINSVYHIPDQTVDADDRTDLDRMMLVTYQYSTNSADDRPRANQIGSWELTLETEMEDVEVTKFYWDFINETWNDWAAEWRAEDEANRPESLDPPAITIRGRKIYVKLSAYGEQWQQYKFAQKIGKVNSDNWFYTLMTNREQKLLEIKTIKGQKVTTNDLVVNDNDIGSWLLDDVNMSILQEGLCRYDFIFVYNPNTHNYNYGLTTNIYDTTTFAELLEGLDQTESDARARSND